MRLTDAGKFWGCYTLFAVLTFFCLSLWAADADPNGFQYRERNVDHPCYQGLVTDCVDILKQQGTTAYCEWAAQMATYGAYMHEVGVRFDKIKVVPHRPLTAQEKREIDHWLRFGYASPVAPYFAFDAARTFCRTQYQLQGQQFSQLKEWK